MPELQTTTFDTLIRKIADRAHAAGVFGQVDIADGRLRCAARGSAAPAWYRVCQDDGRTWIELVTADRWLSQSIEQDLVHTGDKLTELLDEELVELGHPAAALPIEHFRSEDKLYTFRSPLLPGGPNAEALATGVLLAYEACFRRLGDMEEKED